MNIIFIITAFVAGVVIFGLPTWNLARLRDNSHILWLITPPVIVISLFSLTRSFDGNMDPFWYIFFNHGAFYITIFFLFLFGFSGLWMIIGRIFKISKQKIFWLIIISTLLYFIAARINGERVIIKEIDIPAENISRGY